LGLLNWSQDLARVKVKVPRVPGCEIPCMVYPVPHSPGAQLLSQCPFHCQCCGLSHYSVCASTVLGCELPPRIGSWMPLWNKKG
jgi:hypothetical protein